ncbi:anti-sigma factor [Glycomyces artemisiae]|uniref:Regulator of SigK n=1 Tax=Glycomyces artemisiae TaxID=1076443 RepID=A0A2T0UP07_9ACTN|nr:anti-sigma factor [Glycomyces artemisiae]PRY59662.1 anti-sigma-K factor RskA [Glycomyces artemisiae]
MSADVHTLIGAWAVDALDDDERAEVEHHLGECESCAQEAAELREAVWRLSDVTIADPPPRLRARVLTEVARTRQEAPEPPAAEPRTARPRLRRHRGMPRLRLALAAGALAAVMAVVGGIVTWSVMRDTEPSRSDQIAAVLESGDAAIGSIAADGGGKVSVVYSEQLDKAVVVLAGLAAIGEERSYQIWMVDPEGQVSAGVMDPGDRSATMLVEGLGDAELIGVTQEPAGGSETPTLPLVAGVPLEG